ncbi:CD1375 family protein [Cohnella sp. WQ 127256]|nr:CD1375 family protein [Cohnella sp. WQ 127256]
MAKVYSNLIRKGLKTINDVPSEKRAEVESILVTDA